jgi:hypothetical protein
LEATRKFLPHSRAGTAKTAAESLGAFEILAAGEDSFKSEAYGAGRIEGGGSPRLGLRWLIWERENPWPILIGQGGIL